MPNTGSPSFEIVLDGVTLSGSTLRHLLRAELRESLDALDALTLTLVVPQNPGEVTGLAKPGSSFVVRLGQGDERREVHGSIVEVSHSRGVSAPWTLTFSGLDRLHELTRKRAKKVRQGSDASVVQQIASECGLRPEIEDVNATGDYTLQLNEDYASFLLRVARANDYIVRIEDHDTLRFSRRLSAYQAANVSLRWGEDIEQIELSACVRDVVSEVKVRGWNPLQGEWVSGSASAADLAKFSGGSTGPELARAAFGEWVLEVDNAKVSSSSKAKAMAKVELQRRANSFVSGTVECPGLPGAVSGARLSIANAGKPLSGDFVIGETMHALTPDAGYRTTIRFFSDSLPRGGAA